MESRGNIEKPEADIAIRRVPEQKYSTSRREFFTRVPGAAVTLASAPVPVISPAVEPKRLPGAANKRAAIRPDAVRQATLN